MTHLDVINRGLLQAGANSRTEVDGTDSVDILIKAFYERSWKDVLNYHPWIAFRQEEYMEGDETEASLLRYEYFLPGNLVSLHEVKDAAGKPVDYQRFGGHLRADKDELYISYITGSLVLPVRWATVSTYRLPDVPGYIDESVSLRFASQIVFKLSQDANLQANLHNRFIGAIQEGKRLDTYGTGGERLWGQTYGNGEL